ncbi:M1 family metallopeptidase [Candidatus Saccharibacteria bacterium]|nr:M1 family metallopeptidase [Candidatus Saccharibacteria bacterium]
MRIDKHLGTIGGVVTVLGEAKAETVKFHAVDLEIVDVLVNGEKAKFKIEDGVLVILAVSLGEAEITIYYDGRLSNNMNGAYLSTYEYKGKTETIVATQFESHYARMAFPCIDEPAAKAVFELTISVPEESEDIILSNTPIAEERAAVAGFKATAFESTPRMSTYLLAWVIGKFHGKSVTNAHGTKITTYAALNQDLDAVDFANEIAAKSLEFYDDNFGEAYPLKKLDQVALPDFEVGAMENWGLVTYREVALLVSRDATLGAKKAVALTVAHELAHQWFGDLVTMAWWDDLWLNESFASVMEYYTVDAIHPEYKIFEGFFTGDCCAALNRDAYKDVQSVHQEVSDSAEIESLFDSAIVYAKGARLMLMLMRLTGWENFCQGVAKYFDRFKYQNAVGDDLWECLRPYADFDPKKLMHAFIDQPGYPVITNLGGDFKEFSQKRFLLDGPMELSDWPLPEITEDMSGHYVLNLTDDEFKARLANFENLGLEEKLRLLIDRDLITRSGLGKAATLVPLAQKFKNESSPAVWNKIATLIANLKTYFDDESEGERLLKRYVWGLVDQKLRDVGITTGKNDDEEKIRLRANLLGLDYFAEDEARLKQLAAMYEADYKKMDKEIRSDILSAKVYLEPTIVEEYLAQYKAVMDPDVKSDYLVAASLVRDYEQLRKLLALLGDTKTVKPQDQLYLFIYLYRNPKSRKEAFDWLVGNWEVVKRLGGDKSLSDYPMLIARLARTEEELDKFIEFFGPMRDDLALTRIIQIGENEIRARLKLIKENQVAVLEALKLEE